MAMNRPERDLEVALVTKLRDLKYEYRPDIRDRATLEANFRKKFEALNRVALTDGEFQRLLDEIVTPDVFTAARTLRERNSFSRGRGRDRTRGHAEGTGRHRKADPGVNVEAQRFLEGTRAIPIAGSRMNLTCLGFVRP